MNSMEFQTRRKKVFDLMKDNSIMILFSGIEKNSGNSDETMPHFTNSNFYYLVGFSQPNSALILMKKDEICREYLFIDDRNPEREKWVGPRISIEEAKKHSLILDILPNSLRKMQLTKFIEEFSKHIIYVDHLPGIKIDTNYTTLNLVDDLKKEYSRITVEDANPFLVSLRLVKSEEEIKQIREAIRLTKRGLEVLRNSLEPGLYEYQLKALFSYAIHDSMNTHLAFPTICASGKNAIMLHYPFGNDKVKSGDLVLFDLGARFNNYCSDISRTFPASGKFNPLQKSIYEIVLSCNKHIISFIKPGLSLKDLQVEASRFLKEQCVLKGLLKENEDIITVYYHGVSHHLGLDTHDLATFVTKEEPLRAGNVITVEPGLYFEEYGIGVRIEDNVLVTENGAENLSREIPKEIFDIEK